MLLIIHDSNFPHFFSFFFSSHLSHFLIFSFLPVIPISGPQVSFENLLTAGKNGAQHQQKQQGAPCTATAIAGEANACDEHMHCNNNGRGGTVLAMGAHGDGDCDNDDNGNGDVCVWRWQWWGGTHAGNESALQQRQQGRGCTIDGHVQGKVPHWQLAIGTCTNGQWVQWGRHHAGNEHTSQQQLRWQGRLHTGNGACGNSNGDGGGVLH